MSRLDLDASEYPSVPEGKPHLWTVALQGGFCFSAQRTSEVVGWWWNEHQICSLEIWSQSQLCHMVLTKPISLFRPWLLSSQACHRGSMK